MFSNQQEEEEVTDKADNRDCRQRDSRDDVVQEFHVFLNEVGSLRTPINLYHEVEMTLPQGTVFGSKTFGRSVLCILMLTQAPETNLGTGCVCSVVWVVLIIFTSQSYNNNRRERRDTEAARIVF